VAGDHDAALAETVGVGPATDATLPAPTSDRRSTEGIASRDTAARYDVREELGRGGIGRVLLVHDRELGRDLALKELLADGASEGVSIGAIGRFLREARVTARLEHPGIVPVHELGRRADGALYYTMKRVRGRSLSRVLADAKSIPERLGTLRAFRDVCDAVAYAHAHGVVHRDLKPDNVMIGEFGETVVLDWGIAKLLDAADAADEPASERPASDGDPLRSVDGAAMGTPSYMSPEQARGAHAEVDERSDVWGLGAILFEILTGRPPFTGTSVVGVLAKVLSEPPPRVLAREPNAPPELAAIADHALRVDPARRYRSATELAQEVGAYLDGRAVRAYEYSSLELLRRFVRRNRAAALAASIVLVATACAAAFSFWRYREERAAHADAEARRAEADDARTALGEEVEATSAALAEALVERAERALAEHEVLAARLYAADALERARPGAPSDPINHGVLARARSVLLAADEADRWELAERTDLGEAASRSHDAIAVDARTLLYTHGNVATVIDRVSGRAHTLEGDVHVAALVRDGTAFVDSGAANAVRALDGTVLAPLALTLATPMAAAADGGRIVVGSASGTIVVSDAANDAELARGEIGAAIDLLAIDATATVIAVVSRAAARLVVLRVLGSSLETLLDRRLAGGYGTLTLARSGTWLAHGGYPEPVRVLALPDGHELFNAPGGNSGTFELDSEHLLEGSSMLRVLEIPSGRPVESVLLPVHRFDRGSWARDGVDLWAMLSDPLIERTLTLAHWERVMGRTSPHHTMAHGIEDIGARAGSFAVLGLRELALFRGGSEALEREPTLVPGPPNATLAALDVAADGTIAARDRSGGVWLLASDASEFRSLRPQRHPETLTTVRFGTGGRLFVPDEDGTVSAYDVARGERIAVSGQVHHAAIINLGTSHDGSRVVTASLDGRVCVLDADTLAPRGCLDGHERLAGSAMFSPDDRTIATGDGAGWIRIVDAETLAERARYRAHGEWVNQIVWSDDGHLILTLTDDGVGLFEAASGAPLRVMQSYSTIGGAFVDDGRTACWSNRDTVECIDVGAARAEIDHAIARAEAERRSGMRLVGFELVTTSPGP
jgi:WD40 repeat protein